MCFFFFFFNDTATTEIYTLSLHDALPIWTAPFGRPEDPEVKASNHGVSRSEEHTSELQSHVNLVCRLLLEKKKNITMEYFMSKEKKTNNTQKNITIII